MSDTRSTNNAIESSLLSRAQLGDTQAIKEMFARFLPEDETPLTTYYLGIEGMWGLGKRSFGCVTSRRIASLQVGAFGEVVYQDGALEFLNSALVVQPSKLALYVYGLLIVMLAIPTFGLSLLLLPLVAKFYYRIHKCGAVFKIAEGISVYIFTNRKLLARANALYRAAIGQREGRLGGGGQSVRRLTSLAA
jgi:hypothetical protein